MLVKELNDFIAEAGEKIKASTDAEELEVLEKAFICAVRLRALLLVVFGTGSRFLCPPYQPLPSTSPRKPPILELTQENWALGMYLRETVGLSEAMAWKRNTTEQEKADITPAGPVAA